MRRGFGSKVLSVVMSVVLAVGLMPLPALADAGGSGGIQTASIARPLDAEGQGGDGDPSSDLIASGESGTCTWEIDADGKLTIRPTSGDEGTLGDWGDYPPWYSNSEDVTSVAFVGDVKARTCRHMFDICADAVSIDLSGLDTSSVTDMSGMFDCCNSLASLDLSPLDTSNVTDMTSMFSNCHSLTSLDLSPLDTSNVSDMGHMFYGCSELVSLDLSLFRTSQVTNMEYMFYGGSILTFLDLSSFDTSAVSEMNGMFDGCDWLRTLVLGVSTVLHSGCALPDGAWAFEDDDITFDTTDEFIASYDGATMAGTWERTGSGVEPEPDNETVYVTAPDFDQLESEHPYADDLDKTWVYTDDDAEYGMAVTFSGDTETEGNCDFIAVLNAEDEVVGEFSGAKLSGKTVYVPNSSSFKIRLTTDGSVTGYGFKVTNVRTLEEGEEVPEEASLDDCWAEINGVYALGEAPVLRIRQSETEELLVEGEDYEVELQVACIDDEDETSWEACAEASEIGLYRFAVTGLGKYAGSAMYPGFEVAEENDLRLASIQKYDYSPSEAGSSPKFRIVLYDGTVLSDGDYTVAFSYYDDEEDAWVNVAASDLVAGSAYDALISSSGSGKCVGTASCSYEVSDNSDTIDLEQCWFGNDGDSPFVTLGSDQDIPYLMSERGILRESIDYSVTYWGADGTEAQLTSPGAFRAVYVGMGSYSGSCETAFEAIDPSDPVDLNGNVRLSARDVALGSKNFNPVSNACRDVYFVDGDELRPWGLGLSSGVDYGIAILDADGEELEGVPAEVGGYVVRVSGKGLFTGSVELPFRVLLANDIGLVGFWADGEYEAGSEFAVQVSNDGVWDEESEEDRVLQEGTDYEVAGYYYVDATGERHDVERTSDIAGDVFYVIIRGIGAFTGSTSVQAQLIWRGFDDAYSSIEYRAYAQGEVPELRLRFYEGNGLLEEGVDYERQLLFSEDDGNSWVAREAVDGIGYYCYDVIGKGSYIGRRARYDFWVAGETDLALAEVTQYVYFSSDIGTLPKYRVVLRDGTVLSEDDYRVAVYRDGEDGDRVLADPAELVPGGSYEVIISAVEGGACVGAATCWLEVPEQFEEADLDLSSCGLWGSRFVALGAESSLLVGYHGSYLIPAANYDVSYEKDGAVVQPTQPGTYLATFAGKGDFFGSFTVLVELIDPVVPVDIATGSEANASNVWFGSGQEPGISLSRMLAFSADGGEDDEDWAEWVSLNPGVDYTVTYVGDDGKVLEAAPIALGDYIARISGKGLFTGSVDLPFKVVPTNDISFVEFWVEDAYEAGSNFTVDVGNGGVFVADNEDYYVLAEGTDYEVVGYYYFDGRDKRRDCSATSELPAGYCYVELRGIGGFTGAKDVGFSVIGDGGDDHDEVVYLGPGDIDQLESDHPYANDLDKTWVYTDDDAEYGMGVTFSGDTETEEGCDFIEIFDADDELVGEYSGDELAGETVFIPDSMSFKIRLTSDGSGVCYGFKVTNVRALEEGEIPGESVDIADATVLASSQVYTGKELTPAITVELDGDVLPEDAYDVAYANNVHAGAATVTVTGKGGYTGVASGTFQIERAQATVTPRSASKVYGEADPELSATVSGLFGSDSVKYSLSREPGEDAGEYVVAASGEEAQGDYSVSFEAAAFTIGPAELTVAARDASKVSGEADPAFEADVTGYRFDDAAAGGVVEYAFEREPGEAPGEYAVTPVVRSLSGNYTAKAVPGTLTVNRAVVTVRVADASKTYGQRDPNFAIEYAHRGLVEEGFVPAFNVFRALGEDVGAYAVQPSGQQVQGGYDIVFEPGTLTIEPARATVKPRSLTKAYGEADPELAADVEGLVAGDALDYSLAREPGEDAGEYGITAEGEEVQGNYLVSFSGATFTVKPKSIEGAEVELEESSCVYDGAAKEPTVKSIGGEALAAGVDFEIMYSANTDAGAATVAVEGKGNYIGRATATFEIARKPVAVRAHDASKVYGEADPELVADVDGLVGDDSVAYSLAREPGEDAGGYSIAPSGEAVQGNYAVSFEAAAFTIGPAELTVAARDASKVSGEADPAFEADVTGYRFDDAAAGGVVEYAFEREPGEAPGEYAVTPVVRSLSGNYTARAVPGTLTVGRAVVTVRVADGTKTYGQRDPSFAIEYAHRGLVEEGFVPVFSVFRALGEDVGAYAVQPFGSELQGGYDIVYEPGALTIEPARATVRARGLTKAYGEADPELAADVDGLVPGDEVAYSLSREPGEDAATYAIKAEGEEVQGNYLVSFSGATFTVKPKSIKGARLVLSKTDFTYSSKVQKPTVKTVGGKALKSGTDYAIKYSNVSSSKPGTYKVWVEGKGNYAGASAKSSYVIAMLANPAKVTAKSPSVSLSKVRKAKQVIAAKKAFAVSGNKGGKVTYKKVSGDKALTVASNGKVTLAKGAKKGPHSVKVKVSIAAKGSYAAFSKTVTLKVTVK